MYTRIVTDLASALNLILRILERDITIMVLYCRAATPNANGYECLPLYMYTFIHAIRHVSPCLSYVSCTHDWWLLPSSDVLLFMWCEC